MRRLAKIAIIIALASSVGAYQPPALRSFAPASKAVGSLKQQMPVLSLRQRTQKPVFLKSLRSTSAADPVCREQMYEIAQASSFLFIFFIIDYFLDYVVE
jgi:hypothetical protein